MKYFNIIALIQTFMFPFSAQKIVKISHIMTNNDTIVDTICFYSFLITNSVSVNFSYKK